VRPPRFLHIGIGIILPDPSPLEAVIASESFDWLRYAGNCYIAWSSSDCETICRKILRIPGLESANLFIGALDTNEGFGFLPQWCWEWLNRDRGFGQWKLWDPPPEPAAAKLTP
jgi:hypothetical protein